LKIILVIILLNYSFPEWRSCKEWIKEGYQRVFPSQPKTTNERKAWADKVYKKAILSNDSLLLAEAYYLYGKVEHITFNNYFQSKFWLLKSLLIQEKRGPSYELSRLYELLAIIEIIYGDFNRALANFHKSLSIAKEAKINRQVALINWRLGTFYSGNLDLYASPRIIHPFTHISKDSALYYSEKAVQLSLEGEYTDILMEMKILNENQLDTINRSQRLERLIKNLTSDEDRSTLKISAFLKLAESYMDQGNFVEAKNQITNAEKAYKRVSRSPQLERNINLTYIKYCELTGNWKEAYFLMEKVREEDQKLLVNERNALRDRFDSEQKEIVSESHKMELKLHSENILLQNRLIVAFSLLVLISSIVAILFYRLNRKNKQISIQNALLVQEQNHRFNNNLQTISSLFTLKSNDLTTKDAMTVFNESKLLIRAISSLQRKLYSADKLVSVELHNLIPEVVSEVLNAFKMNKVKTTYEISPLEVYADDALNLNLIFTELTINACKHAFNTSTNPTLKITIKSTGEKIEFCFKDNGTQELEISKESFGMFLIQQLMKQMQGSYRFYFDNGMVCEGKCKIKLLK
jgi:two-component sensor histidine kinase